MCQNFEILLINSLCSIYRLKFKIIISELFYIQLQMQMNLQIESYCVSFSGISNPVTLVLFAMKILLHLSLLCWIIAIGKRAMVLNKMYQRYTRNNNEINICNWVCDLLIKFTHMLENLNNISNYVK